MKTPERQDVPMYAAVAIASFGLGLWMFAKTSSNASAMLSLVGIAMLLWLVASPKEQQRSVVVKAVVIFAALAVWSYLTRTGV